MATTGIDDWSDLHNAVVSKKFGRVTALGRKQS
jgi:hypothetical protein